jgi:hypothetical protein
MGSSSVGTLEPRYAIQIGALIQINHWPEVDPTATRISTKGFRHAARAPKLTREPKEPIAVPPQEAPSPLPTVSDEPIAIEFNDFCLSASWRAAISCCLKARLHFLRNGPAGAYGLAGQGPGHRPRPALGQLARAVRRSVPVCFPWPPKLGIQ